MLEASQPDFLLFWLRDGPFESLRPIPNAPERSWHASGSIFNPNLRFWIRFGAVLMIWAWTDIWGWTWTRPGAGWKPWDQAWDWPEALAGGPGQRPKQKPERTNPRAPPHPLYNCLLPKHLTHISHYPTNAPKIVGLTNPAQALCLVWLGPRGPD